MLPLRRMFSLVIMLIQVCPEIVCPALFGVLFSTHMDFALGFFRPKVDAELTAHRNHLRYLSITLSNLEPILDFMLR